MLTLISGTLLGMLGGFILGKMNLERYLSDWVKAAQQQSDIQSENWEVEKIPFFKEYSSTSSRPYIQNGKSILQGQNLPRFNRQSPSQAPHWF